MQIHEGQMENQEDAFFALLVRKCMDRKGERYLALNEEVKRNTAGIVPPGACEHGLRTINRAFRKQWCQKAGRVTTKILTRVAVAVCCMVLLFATAFAVSPTVREQVYALVKEVMEDSTELSLVGDGALQGDALNAGEVSVYGYSEPVLPEGFALVNTWESEENYMRFYTNEDGASIRVKIKVANETLSHHVDTEDADVVIPFAFNYMEGLLVEKDGISMLYAADTVHGLYITIIGEGVPNDTLVTIVAQMSYVG